MYRVRIINPQTQHIEWQSRWLPTMRDALALRKTLTKRPFAQGRRVSTIKQETRELSNFMLRNGRYVSGR